MAYIHTLAVALAAMCAVSARAEAPEFIMDVDTGDEMLQYQEGMTAADVDKCVKAVKDAGITSVALRMQCLGIAQYRSPVLASVDWAHSVEFKENDRRRNPKDSNAPYLRLHKNVEIGLKATLAKMDIPREVVRACKEQGVKIYFWVDLFDEMFGKFLYENPDCQVHTPEGVVFPGLRDYSNEKAVAEKLEEIAEMLEYGPEGIYLCTSCHTRHRVFPEPDGAFGRLEAKYMTDFLARLKKLCEPKGVKIYPGISIGEDLEFYSPYFSNHSKYTVVQDWKTWVDEKLVDGLIIGDYECLWNKTMESWKKRGITKNSPEFAIDALSKPYIDYAKGKVKLLFFGGSAYQTASKEIKDSLEMHRVFADTILRHGYDGVMLHEVMGYENRPGLFGELKRETIDRVNAARAEARPLKLSTAVDYLDSCFFSHDPAGYHTVEELRSTMKTAYEHGIRKVYFRGTGGRSYYDSKVRPKYVGEHRAGGAKLAKAISMYDPVEEFVKVCHELGMEIHYWETIFDCDVYQRYYPGMKDYELYGESASSDPTIPKRLFAEHRMNKLLPVSNLPRPIATIRLRSGGKFTGEINDKNLILYTAPHGKPFTRYTKPFQVKVAPTKDGKDTYVAITGLEIENPVIKFASDEIVLSSDTQSRDAVRAFYADGEECTLYRTVEGVLQGDIDHEHMLWGVGGISLGWGNQKGGLGANKTMIARFGDFERNARGVLDYAYPESRARLINIVKELYEKYPTLDGVTFSIRSHSLPDCGYSGEAGGGRFFYGFSDIVVDEYKKRYGTDLRTEDYDEKKFLKLRGEYLTELLKEVSKIVHEHKGEFQMMAPADRSVFSNFSMMKIAHGSMFPWWCNTTIDDMFDIRTWAEKGYVDSILMIGTEYHQPIWTDAWKEEARRFRSYLEGTGVKLALHYLSAECFRGELEKFFPQLVADEVFDEIEFYEEYHLRNDDPKIYPCIKKTLEESGRKADK